MVYISVYIIYINVYIIKPNLSWSQRGLDQSSEIIIVSYDRSIRSKKNIHEYMSW